MAKWLKDFSNFLIITGPAGTGKTYFCSAVIEGLITKNKMFSSFRFWGERDLLKRLRMSMKDSSYGDYIDHLQYLIDDDFIIVDDLFSSGHNQWREEVILELIDYRYRRNLPTIFTSNLNPSQIQEIYGERIFDRLFATQNMHISYEGMESFRRQGL